MYQQQRDENATLLQKELATNIANLEAVPHLLGRISLRFPV